MRNLHTGIQRAAAICALACGLLGGQTLGAEPRRPNFLWLIAEDFGPHLGCYGTREVWTPNLDRLAAEGVRYTRFFDTAPVCSSSRSAFMTGMFQTTIGAHNHRSHRDDGYRLPEGVRLLTDWFREAGYFTANVRELPAACGFSGTGKTDWNFTYDGRPFDSDRWSDLRSHQPFYAQINFKETHRKFNAPKRADPAKVDIPPYYPDHPVTRQDWAEYLDSATELDRKVGEVLKQLDADGLADTTVVVFFGDNGQAHVRGKQFCYDEGLLAPLLIRWPKGIPVPRHFPPGTVAQPHMMSIPSPRQYVCGARDRWDMTVFRLRTVRDERYRYIRNFTPDRPFLQFNAYKERSYPVWNLLKELNAEGKLTPAQAVLCAPTMPEEELYDLQNDPHEIHNLAGSTNPEHQAALKRRREALAKGIDQTNDQGKVLEPPEVVAAEGRTKPAPADEKQPGKKRKKGGAR